MDVELENVVAAAREVHKTLGPGLLPAIYKHCLSHELSSRVGEHYVDVPIPVQYKSEKWDCGMRSDIMIPERLLIEVRTVELSELHEQQIRTLLKFSNIKTGLLINFNSVDLKDGIKRVDI